MSERGCLGPGQTKLSALPPDAHQSPGAFDANAEVWEDYTNTPLGQLRQELTQRYLARHLGGRGPCLTVLDAGGGTGGYALPLVQEGHRVCLLDFSSRMLDMARQKAERLDSSMLERLCFYHASVDDIPLRFDPDSFDLVLCHTLLEYVPRPWDTLRALVAVLKPDGLLSLLCVNPDADTLRWALAKGDLEKARLALNDRVSPADLFGVPRRTLPGEAMREALADLGIEAVAEYGVRIFADYVAGEQLADPASYELLLELEVSASTLLPYRQIARYYHTVGTKRGR